MNQHDLPLDRYFFSFAKFNKRFFLSILIYNFYKYLTGELPASYFYDFLLGIGSTVLFKAYYNNAL